MNKSIVFACRFLVFFVWSVILVGCGGGGNSGAASALLSSSYSISGSMKGLQAGTEVTLTNNSGDPLVVKSDGVFIFANKVQFNGSYSIAIKAQPSGQICSLAEGTGSASGVVADVTNIQIVCSTSSYSIGGTVTGLMNGQTLLLTNNDVDTVTVSADGSFIFPIQTPYLGGYSVRISAQPVGQTCSLAAGTGSGSGVTADIGNVQIACSTNSYFVGGTVSGLTAGQQVTLTNNDVDSVTVSTDGSFVFATKVASSGSYVVRISTQPVGQICSIAGATGSGVEVTANINSVQVVCSPANFKIEGLVVGLTPGAHVTLRNNLADDLTVDSDGSFAFLTPVAYGGSYSVTVATQPTGLNCSVTDGQGTGVTADVHFVQIQCAAPVFYSVTVQLFSYSGATGTVKFTLNRQSIPDPQVSVNLVNGSDVTTTLANHNLPDQTDYSIDIDYDHTALVCGNINGQDSGRIFMDALAQYYCAPKP